MSIAARLREALQLREMSMRQFHLALPEGLKGSGYSSVRSYIEEGVTPSADFVREAARTLEVREAWLLAGEGEPTEQREQSRVNQRALEWTDQRRQEITKLVEGLPDADPLTTSAVLRFSQKLDDAGLVEPRLLPEERTFLLRAAHKFLVGVEAAFQEATKARKLSLAASTVLRSSASTGWYVQWSDLVLQLFSTRVVGLGERAGTFDDAHAPTAGKSQKGR